MPWVERDIVDRPGVPPSLYNKYWVGGGQVGHVGTTARMVLPKDEEVLGADAGRVASYVINPTTSRPIAGPEGVEILVRDITTGATLRTVETPVVVASGLLAGSLLFWTGDTVPLNSTEATDAGVWVIDLDVPDSSPRAVIPPADLDEQYGPDTVRGQIRLTDHGRTVVTLVQSPTDRATQVIDVESLSLHQTVDGMYALDVVDNVALVVPLHGDEGPVSRVARLIDLTTGDAVGPGVTTDEVLWATPGNGEVYVQLGLGGAGYSIVAIDISSGESRVLLSQVTLDLSHRLSAPDNLVLVSFSWPVGPDGKVHQPVTLLDPSTGRLQPEAFTIGNP